MSTQGKLTRMLVVIEKNKNIAVFQNVSSLPLVTQTEGGAEAQLVERVTPCEKVPGSIPAAAARSPLVGSVSV